MELAESVGSGTPQEGLFFLIGEKSLKNMLDSGGKASIGRMPGKKNLEARVGAMVQSQWEPTGVEQ
jgi:hypothetical protein